MYDLINSMRNMRDKIPVEEITESFRNELEKSQDNFEAILKNTQEQFENFLLTFKVLCLAEEFDNLLMWSHYAKNHTGVVLRFSCKSEPDTVLLIAKPITYRAYIPKFASLDEYVLNLTGQNCINMEKKFHQYVYSKSIHWKYEKEWRVWRPMEDIKVKGVQYVDIEILPSEIDGIIFGCRIKEEDKEELIELAAKNDFKLLLVLQAKTNDHRFALDFDEIS